MFWNDNDKEFVVNENRATLFYNDSDAGRVLNELSRKNIRANTEIHYVAAVVVRIRAARDVKKKDVIGWLHKTCRLTLDSRCGRGPIEDSHGYISIEWGRIVKEGECDVSDER